VNARHFALCASHDPGVQEKIVFELERHAFSEAECSACLDLFDSYIEGVVRTWLHEHPDVLLKAAARAVDRVWCSRGTNAEVPR
jgi:hypothetical protein